VTDLIAVRGDDEDYDLTVATGAGVAIDLTNATLWFTVKKDSTDADLRALIQKTTDDGIDLAYQGVAVPSGADTTGQATIHLDPADTIKIKPGTYVYDVQMMISGVVTTLVDGDFEITADVTRSTTV
jgi:hypothetical protein